MAPEASVLINIDGRPFMLSKHLKKSNLINIISKLQDDLTKIKIFTKTQVDFKLEYEKIKTEYDKLKDTVAKENDNKESQNEFVKKENVAQEPLDLRSRLKETYESKAMHTVCLYEEKIDQLRKRIVEIEKDREAFGEAIEKKQALIRNLKKETETLKKEKEDLQTNHNEVLQNLQQKHETEKQQMDREKQKLLKEKEVLQKTYIDLDKIRKYLEKNNAFLKGSLSETNHVHDDRIKKLTEDFEEKERKHVEEIKRMQQNVDGVVREAELKIERIEGKLAKAQEEYEGRIGNVTKENETLQGSIRNYEQEEESLRGELSMYRNLVEQTRRFYEDSIRTLNGKFYTEKDKIDQEMLKLKSNYELKINELKNGKELIEGDTNLKSRKIAQLLSENKFMAEKIVELRLKSEESSRKYIENYHALKDKVEMMKAKYEREKLDLKTEINTKEKTIDDLNISLKRLEKQIKGLLVQNDMLKQENEKDLEQIWLKIQNQKETYLEELENVKNVHCKKMKLIENDLEQAKVDYDVLDKQYNELLSTKQSADKTCQNLRLKLCSIEEEHRKEVYQLKESFRKEERAYRQDYDKQKRDLQNQKKQTGNYETELLKLKAINEDLQKSLQNHETKNKEEIDRLKRLIEENTICYRDDLQSMKQLLSYKEEIIRKLEEKLNEHEINHNLGITEHQANINRIEEHHKQLVDEIQAGCELQRQKYDILIYELYRELKEEQYQTDELTKIRASLEEENQCLKSRNTEIISNLTKQKEKFSSDSEFVRFLEFLLT